MNISESVQNHLDDPAALESLYHQTRQDGREQAFRQAVEELYGSRSEHVLLQAWHHRLTFESTTEAGAKTNWTLAGILSILTGLVFWALSGEDLTFFGDRPVLVYLGAPIATLFILGFLSAGDAQKRRKALIFGGLLAVMTLCILLIGHLDFEFQEQYLDLSAIHLPFLSWAAVGLSLTTLSSGSKSVHPARFGFIRKSLEVFVTGGLYLAAGMVFAVITVGMFEALQVTVPEAIVRLVGIGGVGLLPVLAVASTYDADRLPEDQQFGQGVGRLVPILTRLLLPLSLIVLVVYIMLIPFNFYAPFQDRDVLIVYNIMLFAVMVLSVGLTPIKLEEMNPVLRPWIRNGVIALAALAVLVGIYALAAVVTRTIEGGWTANRITVIGWNVVNIGLLIHVVWAQLQVKNGDWPDALKQVFGKGAIIYIAWVLGLMLLLPLVLAFF